MASEKNLIPYGLRNGHIISIEDLDEKTEAGKKCNCYCPRCNAPLLAKIKKGEKRKRRKHFAHDGSSNCSGAYESALHMLVKEVIDEGAKIKLPPIVSTLAKSGYFVLDDIVINNAQISDSMEIEPDVGKTEVEKNLGEFRPDVIIESLGNKLIIEVLVSHAVDEEKKKRIREYGVSCLELDFSYYRDIIIEKGQIRKALEGNDSNVLTRWVYNKKQDRIDSFLKLNYSNIWILESSKQVLKPGICITELGNKHKISNKNTINGCAHYSRLEIPIQQLHRISERLYSELVLRNKNNSSIASQVGSNEYSSQLKDSNLVWNQEDIKRCLDCNWNNGFLTKLDSKVIGFLICTKDNPKKKEEIAHSCSLIIEFAKNCIIPYSGERCKELVHAFVLFLTIEYDDKVKESEEKAIEILLGRLCALEEKEEEKRRNYALTKEQREKEQREEWFRDRKDMFNAFEKGLRQLPLPHDLSFDVWCSDTWRMLQRRIPTYFFKKYGPLYMKCAFNCFAKGFWEKEIES